MRALEKGCPGKPSLPDKKDGRGINNFAYVFWAKTGPEKHGDMAPKFQETRSPQCQVGTGNPKQTLAKMPDMGKEQSRPGSLPTRRPGIIDSNAWCPAERTRDLGGVLPYLYKL